LRLAVAYDGTDFCGFQWQPAVRTVAGTLEAALAQVLGEPVKIAGAGRTDAGVHATGQVVSLATRRAFPFEHLAAALNATLPTDLCVIDSEIASPDFSARFSALERTYVYAILARRQRDALLARYAYHVWRPLDLERMKEAAEMMVGEHDFRSFCGTPPESGITVRAIRRLEIVATGELIRITVTADGFLHRMVRTIVGTLVEIGSGRRSPNAIPTVLAARDRAAAGLTAPAQGLYLAGVRYEDGYDFFREPALTAGVLSR
jgi:tRNA pseudouridine38-40 synthase